MAGMASNGVSAAWLHLFALRLEQDNLSDCRIGYADLCAALQLEDNLKSIELVPKLTQEVMDKIDAILKNKPEPAATYGR